VEMHLGWAVMKTASQKFPDFANGRVVPILESFVRRM
jgi:hypothetical protein